MSYFNQDTKQNSLPVKMHKNHKVFSKVKYTWICIARLRANASKALRYGSYSVTCKQHHICLYSQSQSITAL